MSLARTLVALALLAVSGDQFFDSNGVRIRYVVAGAGEPVVLIHGWAADAEMWRPLMADLSRDHRVIAFDCRGHGKSGKPHDSAQYGIEMTRDVTRLLDHLGIKRAHIIGYSMGGSIAIKLLSEHPERFLTAVIGGSEGFRNPEDFDTEETPLIKSLRSGMPLSEAMIANAPPNWPKPTPEQRAMMAENDAGQDSLALAAQRLGNVGLKVDYERLRKNRVPTLVIYGGLDNPSRFDTLKSIMPNAEFVAVEGARHGEVPSRPEFIKAVRDFLARHSNKVST
jgi:pimeloyl-ACP methyl ester carboxylesterase